MQQRHFEDYDSWSKKNCNVKVLNVNSTNPQKRLGDNIYDFSEDSSVPKLRPGLHSEGNRDTDLGGKHVLISDHFFYFGDQPVELPGELLPIVRQGQGHRSTSNAPYFEEFVDWIHSLDMSPNQLHGSPQFKHHDEKSCAEKADCRRSCAEADLSTNDDEE